VETLPFIQAVLPPPPPPLGLHLAVCRAHDLLEPSLLAQARYMPVGEKQGNEAPAACSIRPSEPSGRHTVIPPPESDAGGGRPGRQAQAWACKRRGRAAAGSK
jgi:hypothetical protein